MSAKTYAYSNRILELFLRNSSVDTPTSVYAGLFTQLPTSLDQAGVEVSGNGYTRALVEFALLAEGATQNSSETTFPVATGGDWGDIVGVGIFDAVTQGMLLYYGSLSAPRYVYEGDTASFAVGTLAVSEE